MKREGRWSVLWVGVHGSPATNVCLHRFRLVPLGNTVTNRVCWTDFLNTLPYVIINLFLKKNKNFGPAYLVMILQNV